MSFCEHCTQGRILPGEPTGTMQSDGSYFHPAPQSADPANSKKAIIFLTDIFGLPLKNNKLLPDQLSEALGYDVWAPDVFDGYPPVSEDQLSDGIPDVPGGAWPLWAKLKFLVMVFFAIPRLISSRPSIADERIEMFVKKLQEERKYEKLGAVGYCFGGAAAVRLGSKGLFNSIVVCHPSIISKAEISAINIPTSWVCAEEDFTFGTMLRNEAEALFAARKDKRDYVDYEFREYKGVVHGFAIRPNLGIPFIKQAFEGSFDQTVQWFKKTL
ncbi:dienelactone hydrolase endo-1-3,1,4-beta-D-glucanase [Rickenella mellea]|uniref:Dienelactone hydrolase endo-1-3,1,4-beta-D-glucanase n=1 Tax=Rickenella mellea TaxID=50990 RepID=A0A4Y7Q3A0_9AGAM|nr:dienelactone hydrolase endo-1-3,1,4-beta-D-glucanase [Rickenella mellea]